MVRGFVFLVFNIFLLVFTNNVFAYDNIKIKVVLVNSFDGNQIKANYDLKVTIEESKQEIKISSDKKESYYNIPPGKNIKIVASAVGFYTEQKIVETDLLNDNDVLEVKMNPKPTGKLEITVIDAESKLPLNTDLEIVFFSRTTREKTNLQNPQINYLYDLKGNYRIITSANGYLKDDRTIELDINVNSKVEKVEIGLLKSSKKQEIVIFDKATNSLIEAGEVTVNHVESGKKIFEGKIVSGTFVWEGNRNDNYTIQTKINGYSDLKAAFLLDGTTKKFGVSVLTPQKIDIYDDFTNERLTIDLEITTPSSKNIIIKTSSKEVYNFFPSELGTFKITAKPVGYMVESGTFTINSLNAVNSPFVLRLKKNLSEYVIKVFDSETKNPINNALIKVFNEQSREIQGKSGENQKTVFLDDTKNHFYEVTSEGYFEHTENVKNDKYIQVFLKKKIIESFNNIEISVLDVQTRLPIKDVNLKVFEEVTKPLALAFDPSGSVFKSNKVNPKLKYNYELTAKGYNNLKQDLNVKENKIEIAMTPSGLGNYYFTITDAFTEENLDVTLAISVGGVHIKNEKEGRRIKASLSEKSSYKIVVAKENYKEVSKSINIQEAENGEFKVSLFKNSYPILFKITNNISEVATSEFKASLKNKVYNKTEDLVFDMTKKGFLGVISPEGNYNLEIQIPQYERYTGTFTLKQADPVTLEYVITLNAKEKIAESTILEKPKQVKPVEKPDAVIAKVVEKQVLTATEIKKGVKYPLEGVVFEQSKTSLIKGADEKLEGLVQYLKQNPKAQIEIVGHTDNEGSDQRLNQRLSEFRAKVVANHLFNKGIPADRMITLGKGSSEPVAPNDSDENRAKNRRIEIMILED